MSDREEHDSGSDLPVDEGTSAIEWITAAIGAILFIAMISYMVHVGFGEVDGLPRVELATEAPIRQGPGFHVRFVANNTGDATATNLVVRGVLLENGTEVESCEVTIDYLPMKSSRGGGFIFAHDPARYRLTVTAASYLDP